MRMSSHHDQAGCSPRQATYFFCFAKRSRQEKATPTTAPRCAGFPRCQHLKRGAAKLAPLRYAQTDAAPDPFQVLATWRRRRGSTSKATATATATAMAMAMAGRHIRAICPFRLTLKGMAAKPNITFGCVHYVGLAAQPTNYY